jgi:hypothetical protein
MTNGYLKVVGSTLVQSKIVSVDPAATEDGSGEKSVAIPGFIKYQEVFFFDNRNPESVKRALTAAQEYIAKHQRNKMLARLSVFNPPAFDGLWSGISHVGQGIGFGGDAS